MTVQHPQVALFEPEELAVITLPVCDHYAGVHQRMQKSLRLQARMGPVFDVTLDNEDGAPVGAELEQAQHIAELLDSAENRYGRVGVRLLPLVHPRFGDVLSEVLKAQRRPAYLMLPKARRLADVQAAVAAIDAAIDAATATAIETAINTAIDTPIQAAGAGPVPVHALVETHGALREVAAIAALPRVQSLSFGLMDFVSAHRGAVPQWAMSAQGQFDHPLVVRAKLEIAAACHAHGKVPSHCVVTEFKDLVALREAADKAADLLGYTRMWSIHPAQIQPILEAFAPSQAELEQAIRILQAAQQAGWAPISHRSTAGGTAHDTLHDRASYRYFWQLLVRAQKTAFVGGPQLPPEVRAAWFA